MEDYFQFLELNLRFILFLKEKINIGNNVILIILKKIIFIMFQFLKIKIGILQLQKKQYLELFIL